MLEGNKKPIVINFIGAPCSKKSTYAAGLFHEMKRLGCSVENLSEFAKELTNGERFAELRCQPYVFGHQLYRQEAACAKYDYVITDSPIILSAIYHQGYPMMAEMGIRCFNRFNNFNILMKISSSYETVGRNESLAEALDIQERICNLISPLIIHETFSDNLIKRILKKLNLL